MMTTKTLLIDSPRENFAENYFIPTTEVKRLPKFKIKKNPNKNKLLPHFK